MPKTGRPPTGEVSKKAQSTIRLTPGEVEKLEYCCKVYGLTKAEVFRRGLEELYQKAQKEK